MITRGFLGVVLVDWWDFRDERSVDMVSWQMVGSNRVGLIGFLRVG